MQAKHMDQNQVHFILGDIRVMVWRALKGIWQTSLGSMNSLGKLASPLEVHSA